jgi:hypothetical protein
MIPTVLHPRLLRLRTPSLRDPLRPLSLCVIFQVVYLRPHNRGESGCTFSRYLISFFSFSTSLYNFSIFFRIFSASSALGYKSKYR